MLRGKYEEIYTKRYNELTRKDRRDIKREKKEEEKKRFDIELDDGKYDDFDDMFNI